ncbi:LysR family transcriptional regulator [Achromobacter agilis]|uniref:HTH-type transcriptional regulator GbpR n=1 Tax=Achromobacter agilis TaxID=1353888 RepID=A0A446CLS0_9BURK|nr:LysR family transcriptional regulator [Achromobacter agilis]SSW68842.1 HTH-type transcriptional regulator GbpR [Achromobacter agilis]
MSLSIRSLQHFAVLAEEKHFSRAAQRLHLTQSALTRSIQALEDSLGLVLVDRASTGVVPTQAGRTVLERAQRILGETRDLRREAELIRGHDTGRVNLGVGVFPAAGFLSLLLVRIAREHPGLSVHVEVESWQRLLDKLLQDKLDFAVAVTHSLPPPDDFAVRPLPPQHGGLFTRAGHPLQGVAKPRLRAALGQYRLAATDLPPKARDYLARLYQVTRDELPIAFECDSVAALRDVALGSDVVLFCTREAIAAELELGLLAPLPLAYPATGQLTHNVIHRARRTLSPTAERVIELVQELLEQAAAPRVPARKPRRSRA